MEPWNDQYKLRQFPLFDIFLNSTCPETGAFRWLQQSYNPSSSTAATATASSFLSVLTKPTKIIVVNSSSPSPSPPPIKRRVDDEFGSLLPIWLKDAASSNESGLPWLSMSLDECNLGMPFGSGRADEYTSVEVDERKQVDVEKGEMGDNVIHL
ncbi:hypothetical protein RJ639_017398 [Escallonia herrerae]|uniref:Uncharacterized protein n=1 Tax=Escallonia herrerae TaxID=1293975 RepID=A0AA88VAH5_9ASTE|nr:hypothetical protein RJ639_017398 [Escallonia herrerae]